MSEIVAYCLLYIRERSVLFGEGNSLFVVYYVVNVTFGDSLFSILQCRQPCASNF